METKRLNPAQGWTWLLALIIFFFNSFLLPEGATLTLLLLPLWLYILARRHRLYIPLVLAIPFLAFMGIHLSQGVDIRFYFISLAMMLALLCFMSVFQHQANNELINWDMIFRDIALLNFFFTFLALLFLYIPLLKPITWYLVPIAPNIPVIPRLKLFTLEASHYSFWLAPVAIYFYSRKLFFKTKSSWFTLAIVTLPLALSFSLGVIASLGISFFILIIVYFRRIMAIPLNRMLLAGFIILSVALLIFMKIRYPNNALFVRINDVFSGQDTSARGRTYEAFILARKIIAHGSPWFGIGLGQLKLIGRSIIVQYYMYTNIPAVIRIPNATAETLIYFGYVGLAIRFFLEIFFFFRTKVYRNPYRLWLFVFVFIYQFTGSYITNPAEYIVWILAFSNIFHDFIARKTPTPKPSQS